MYKIIIVSLFLSFSSLFLKAQGPDTLRVQTSAVCGECKEIIERYLSFEKGILSSDLDVKSKVLTVIYNQKKTDPDKIRVAITHSGYDADSLKADPRAFRKLPECCKRPHTE
jgi:periplasmic mercuric ion binding protein